MTGKNIDSFVLSLGGSLIVTDHGIDTNFLKRFRRFILDQVAQGRRFYLVVGGGKTARSYIGAALKVAAVSSDDRDWVGIEATRLNARLVKVVFGRSAYSEIVIDPTKKIDSKQPIICAAGYVPGCSTDYDAVILAKNNNIKTVINLSNIDFVYDRDPRRHSEAKKLMRVSWPDFRAIVGSKWQPGMNVPFDPAASRQAAQLGLKVVILNGRKLSNLARCLDGETFRGTSIE